MYKLFFIIAALESCFSIGFLAWLFLSPEVKSDGAIVLVTSFVIGIFFLWLYLFKNRKDIEELVKTGSLRSLLKLVVGSKNISDEMPK